MARADRKSTKNKRTEKAKHRFLIGMLDMTWRLAAAFLLPLFLGLWLDSVTGNSIFAIIGLLLGVAGSVYVIRTMVKEYSVEVELDE